jgi:hypothetical protein
MWVTVGLAAVTTSTRSIRGPGKQEYAPLLCCQEVCEVGSHLLVFAQDVEHWAVVVQCSSVSFMLDNGHLDLNLRHA